MLKEKYIEALLNRKEEKKNTIVETFEECIENWWKEKRKTMTKEERKEALTEKGLEEMFEDFLNDLREKNNQKKQSECGICVKVEINCETHGRDCFGAKYTNKYVNMRVKSSLKELKENQELKELLQQSDDEE